ncbi:MFS transporter [Streptomyces sp. ICC4]|uniref:MFS transporter n=1 Tax=Streptomyces sp. ICC4 TaxID=2099584 RepID=UPI001EF8C494|nr:MFS transporter [Streptomyces sp. ICC4]
MTDLHSTGAATGTGDRSRPRAVLPALCATQITSWGIVYYAFPVLLPRLTADTGWSTHAATAAFSLALLVSAAVGVPVGRILDRRGPRAVMTTGSVLGTLAILVIAAAPNLPVFTAGWILAGVAMASTFYPPAFAALTRWWGPDRIRALTVVTLAGGLASTLFAPLTAVLADHLSWRSTYAVLAVILAAVTIPAHALALPMGRRAPTANALRVEIEAVPTGDLRRVAEAGWGDAPGRKCGKGSGPCGGRGGRVGRGGGRGGGGGGAGAGRGGGRGTGAGKGGGPPRGVGWCPAPALGVVLRPRRPLRSGSGGSGPARPAAGGPGGSSSG